MFTARTLREGRWPILVLVILTALGIAWCWPAAVVSLVLLVFTISFFRDPDRRVDPDPALIMSPADGRVSEVRPAREAEYLQGEGTMVAIFLSIFDVHVQRAPIDGEIKLIKYQPGKFLDARHADASSQNECQLIGIEAPDGFRLGVRQIAGLIARRIVIWNKTNDRLAKGQRFGMIRFGSRVELYLPAGVEVTIKPGDYAWGGETIIARRK